MELIRITNSYSDVGKLIRGDWSLIGTFEIDGRGQVLLARDPAVSVALDRLGGVWGDLSKVSDAHLKKQGTIMVLRQMHDEGWQPETG